MDAKIAPQGVIIAREFTLLAYAEALGLETGQPVSDPAKLIAPMLARFIASDRAFAKARSIKKRQSANAALAEHATGTGRG